MSYFTQQLDFTLTELGLNRSQLAQACGMNYNTLTNFAKGVRPADPESMGIIMSGLPPEHAVQLLVARLRDEIPPGHETAVAVMPMSQLKPEAGKPISNDPPIPENLEVALRKWRHAICVNQDWADLLIKMAAILPDV